MMYVPEDRRVRFNLTDLKSSLNAQWFNPRTGEWTPVGPLDVSGVGQLETPAPGDWVLLLSD